MLALGVVAREATHFGQGSALTRPGARADLGAPPRVRAPPPSAPADIAAHFAVACACAAAVTAARRARAPGLPGLRRRDGSKQRAGADAAAERRRPPRALDLVVSFLPAVAEETLFRGALIPALGGGPVAVVASGCVFGALHVGGGRNVDAAWAALARAGAAAVGTGDVAVAMLAHGRPTTRAPRRGSKKTMMTVTDDR